jgi:hypothetical protein
MKWQVWNVEVCTDCLTSSCDMELRVQKRQQHQCDKPASATTTITMKFYTRMMLWCLALSLVILQMVTDIIYFHRFKDQVREQYVMIGNLDGNNPTLTSELQRRRAESAAVIVPTSSEWKQQLRNEQSYNSISSIGTNTSTKLNDNDISPLTDEQNHIDATKVGIDVGLNDDILNPVLKEGKMYSMCRLDRSGSVITDMIYAHAFAHAHNITYAGSCCVTKGLPKKDTKRLMQSLHWHTAMPFKCPPGVNNKVYNLRQPNATTIHPLLINPQVYRLVGNQSNLTPEWRQTMQKALYKYTDRRKNRPYHIAVHVRRGDVTPCTYTRRYLPNSHYISLIDQYTPNATTLNGRPLQVTIYSESDSFESFNIFRERKYKLALDTKSLAQVWKALSTADVAILSRSFFSIAPAAINPNIVVATDFFGFDVRVMDGWKYADQTLVQNSEDIIHEMRNNQCEDSKDFRGNANTIVAAM